MMEKYMLKHDKSHAFQPSPFLQPNLNPLVFHSPHPTPQSYE